MKPPEQYLDLSYFSSTIPEGLQERDSIITNILQRGHGCCPQDTQQVRRAGDPERKLNLKTLLAQNTVD